MSFIQILLAILLASFVSAAEIGIRSYEGYQVLTAKAVTIQQVKLLNTLELSGQYDFWTRPQLGGQADILCSPQLVHALIDSLRKAHIWWTLKIEDVRKFVEAERAENEKRIRGDGRMAWDAYQRWDVMEPWIQSLQNYFVATVSVIGQTYEKRNIYMVKVSTGKLPGGANKKAIFIDANIHAREWIAGATCTWMLNELVTNAPKYLEILSEIDFYFVPMLNVDGYEFSHTSDRYWRKTRSVNNGTTCRGADPNRNFGFQFGGASTSTDPCSDIFTGPFAWSEREVVAIRDAIIDIQASATIWAYITIHTSGNVWLLSWGYEEGLYPDDYPELLKWGQASIAAIESVRGTIYRTGQGADIFYPVGGAGDDYAKSEGIKYSTTVELPNTADITNLIVPIAQETWAGVLVTARTVMAHK